MSETYFLNKKDKLEKEIEKLKAELSRYPAGSLVPYQIKGKTRWYHHKKKRDGSYERKYIGKDNMGLAQKLARKAYIKSLLKDKENELKSIEQYLKVRKDTDYKCYLSFDSKYRDLLVAGRWDLEDYDRNPSHPENLIVKAPKGEFVRSKSEALIANALFDEGIPYRYECKLCIDDIVVYPDFTVRVGKSNKEVIWEHFGKMDDQEYLDKVMRKLNLYIRNGYYPGKNLLVTYETKANPLVIDDVMKVIRDNFM